MKFTFYKGKKYKLTGKCKKCGKCCIGQVTYIMSQPANKVKSIELQNPAFNKNIHCHSLDIETNLCKVHSKKPSICSKYPRLFQELELFPDCGYKWEFLCDTNKQDITIKLTNKDKYCKDYTIANKIK